MPTTKESIRKKVIEMLDDNRKTMEKKLDALLESGHIDFENTEDNYRLPKMIVCALARETEYQFTPPGKTRADDRAIDMLHIRMNIPQF
ncbi:MAG: hypothetical protein IJ504_00910 [Bacteroidales bacterium]|nr:hypothetical protein [Bacteroidales bacterium]